MSITMKLHLGKRYTIKDVDNCTARDGGFATLKDLSLIMDMCVFDGVLYNLTYEISKRLSLSHPEVYKALIDVVQEYIAMSDGDAYSKFWDCPSPHPITRIRRD